MMRPLAIIAALLAATLSLAALAQHQHQHRHGSAGSAGQAAQASPSLPGQDAFGAIQEIVRILSADPATDWGKVDLAVLREHLIDMNEVTLNARAREHRRPDGIDIDVSGEGRTRAAIRRMVVAHAREIDGMNGWRVRAEASESGARISASADSPAEVAKLHGLGFIGLMVQGDHHQPHHLAMARGTFGGHRH
ncbi:MAG: hypothetical protein KIT81_10040 [Alphaproteobacteria bacterium]|nr:hypothetical protein [Alphaproteobacteria bacterium]